MLSSIASFAATDCMTGVSEYFSTNNPELNIKSIIYKGKIPPHSDRPYYMGEIWNNTDEHLGIYEIKASFMAEFTYVVLVDKNCNVIKKIDVGFED